MPNFFDKLEEIERLMSSNDRANRPFAYSNLLRLQELSAIDPSSTRVLTDSSLRMISSIVADIFEDDEEIAAQALKCLGFTIYHPVIVVAISVDVADAVLESLSEVVTTTRWKSVCNLAVWCISMQQFDETLLSAHFWSLLKAIVHALDNPFGSLSTTFEAIQALLKLASQLRKKMRDTSHFWAPPIYRRLLSNEKRERDMSERCLLKISDIILPPPLALSQALASDVNKKLLIRMKEMLEQCLKVQTMQAWGWFIRLLGHYAMENRCLVNNMLKVMEVTFTDNDTQVQISAQVAWEGLIDAFIPPLASPSEVNTSRKDIGEIWSIRKLKSIKLIMIPIVGIISSKADLSVHSSCLKTWFYLLHRLDVYINHTSVKKLVLKPVFDVVFWNGLENSRMWLWNVCLDLLDGSILIKLRGKDRNSDSPTNKQTLHQISEYGTPASSRCSWSRYPIKWLPWDLCQVDFYIDILYNIVTEARKVPSTAENRSWACHAALRIFRSILKVIQLECHSLSSNYDDVYCCLKKVLNFAKEISSDGDGTSRNGDELYGTSLWFIRAITEELESTVLGSSHFKVPLDIKYIGSWQLVNSSGHAQAFSIGSAVQMGMVSPMVYLVVLYFHEVVQLQSTLVPSKKEIISVDIIRYLQVLLSSNNSLENIGIINIILHNFIQPCSLRIWTAVAEALRESANVKDTAWMQLESDDAGYSTLCQFISYPFFMYSFLQDKAATARTDGSSVASTNQLPQRLDLERVVEVWSSFYSFISNKHIEHFTGKSLHEDLHNTLVTCLKGIPWLPECGINLNSSAGNLVLDLLTLCGSAVTCILEHILTGDVCQSGQKNECDNTVKFSHNSLKLAVRVLSSLRCLASCLCSKSDILVYVETLSCPLLWWLSNLERHCKSIRDQLQLLWVETLNCLLRSEPSVICDPSFLKDQACLLEKTLDHQDPSISDPTVSFWNSTYGKQTDFEYPPRLLHVLDRLSRNGRINFSGSGLPWQLVRGHSITKAPEKYIVTAKHNISSKRVGLMEVPLYKTESCSTSTPSLKRKRPVLAEHQKEVRRAQK